MTRCWPRSWPSGPVRCCCSCAPPARTADRRRGVGRVPAGRAGRPPARRRGAVRGEPGPGRPAHRRAGLDRRPAGRHPGVRRGRPDRLGRARRALGARRARLRRGRAAGAQRGALVPDAGPAAGPPAARAADRGEPDPPAGLGPPGGRGARRRAGPDGLGRREGRRRAARRGRRLRPRRRPVRVGLGRPGRGRAGRRAARQPRRRVAAALQPAGPVGAGPARLRRWGGGPDRGADRPAPDDERGSTTRDDRPPAVPAVPAADPGGRGDLHHPRGGRRVRAAGAAVLRRQGLHRHAAAGREGVLPGRASRSR